MITRRFFIGGAAAFGSQVLFGIPRGFDPGRPKLRFGVITDVHLAFNGKELIRIWNTDTVRRTFEWFRDQGVDAVLCGGDVADRSQIDEMRAFAETWFSVFPDDRRPDGGRVERVFVTGNHDVNHLGPLKNATWLSYYNHDAARITADAMTLRPGGIAQAWEECFGEKYEQIYRKTVKGYDFIGGHWGDWSGVGDIEGFMRKVGPTLDPSKPFFYVQHPHPKDTVYADWAWGADDGRSTRALSAFPNAVAFTGHSHFTLTSDWSIWQGAFTSVGTASLSARVDASYGGRENGGPLFPGEKAHMDKGVVTDVRQGMIVTVYDDLVSIERHDFDSNLPLGEPWVFTTPAGSASPYVPATRSAAVGAPLFDEGAEVTVADGAPRHAGCDKDVRHVTVRFPVPAPKGDTRAFDFEVALMATYNNVTKPFKVKRVMCPSAHFPPAKEAKEAICVFAADELPKAKSRRWISAGYHFAVTPVSSMGVRGNTICSRRFS